MKKILIGSKNPMKTRGISRAFEEFFSEKCDFRKIAAESKVARQPFDDDVYRGAINRIVDCISRTVCENFDYYVSCESGIIEQFGRMVNVQIVLIFDGEYYHYGISNGFEVPSRDITKIAETSLKEVMDKEFANRGGISYLSKNLYSREKLVYDATVMALASMNWKNESKAF